jgi:hypothetical protein
MKFFFQLTAYNHLGDVSQPTYAPVDGWGGVSQPLAIIIRVPRCRQAQTFGRTQTDETSPVPYGTERFIYTADVPDGT